MATRLWLQPPNIWLEHVDNLSGVSVSLSPLDVFLFSFLSLFFLLFGPPLKRGSGLAIKITLHLRRHRQVISAACFSAAAAERLDGTPPVQ